MSSIIAFPVHKRYILNPEKLNQQRLKCASQMREPLYMQATVLRQKNPQVNFYPVRRSESFNILQIFSLFWLQGREGIRVSLSEELTGGDGVFSD